ncbi:MULTISPECIES: hypothetical protein [unclassified Nocardiopsis]|uniref:hypothetical protein n=1 Tax=unclassified Nocardiopsis TaxID=2649073 RepID=UPI0013016844|nr:hypothetical protein [Nocardiopsis sp. TSRI0078]
MGRNVKLFSLFAVMFVAVLGLSLAGFGDPGVSVHVSGEIPPPSSPYPGEPWK